jgi:co-chaperonin GroES (HSP10)
MITPLGNQVLLDPIKADKEIKLGEFRIEIAEKRGEKEPPKKAKVINLSKETSKEYKVNKGDTVLFRPYSPDEVDGGFLLISADELLAKISD